MTIALVGAVNTFPFADGDAGHTCTHASGAPSVGHMDVLFINSNTVVDSVTSSAGAAWSQRRNATDQQGAYVYTRKATGGEPATVVVNTNGDHNTNVHWYRLSGVDDYSDSNFHQATGADTALDALTTGTLVATGMAVLTSAMLHNFTTTPDTQAWANSFTTPGAASSSVSGASNTRVALFTSHKLNVGTASETVSGCTWTNTASDRYCVWVAFTAAAGGGQSAALGTAAETDAAVVLGKAKARATATTTETDAAPAVGRTKNKAVSTATGTDSASSLGRSKSKALGTAMETGVAFSLARAKRRAVGATAESDTALSLGGATEAVGAASPLVSRTPSDRLISQTIGGRL